MDFEMLKKTIKKLYCLGLYEDVEQIIGDLNMLADTLSSLKKEIKDLMKGCVDNDDIAKCNDLFSVLKDIDDYEEGIHCVCNDFDQNQTDDDVGTVVLVDTDEDCDAGLAVTIPYYDKRISDKQLAYNRSKKRPDRTGASWSKDEDDALVAEFVQYHMKVMDIAVLHARTVTGICKRLMKLEYL